MEKDEPASAHGCAPEGRNNYGETDEQGQQRRDRIAKGLKKIADEQKPDFITLQEIFSYGENDSFLSLVKQELGDDWDVVKDNSGDLISYGANITLYRKTKFSRFLLPQNRKHRISFLEVTQPVFP